jgi:hypothetical protein
MIDVTNERLIPLSAVPDLPFLAGCRPSYRTVRRWAGVGLKGHRLDIVQRGGIRRTSAEAVQRFFGRLATPATSPRPPTPRQQQKAQARAKATLDRLGI